MDRRRIRRPNWPLPPVLIGALAQRGASCRRASPTRTSARARRPGARARRQRRRSTSTSTCSPTTRTRRRRIRRISTLRAEPAAEEPLQRRLRTSPTTGSSGTSRSATPMMRSGRTCSTTATTARRRPTRSSTAASASSGLDDKVTTSIKAINLGNADVQQHVFGDVTKRQIVGEVRVQF